MSRQVKPKVFISHAYEDAEIADALGDIIQRVYAGAIEYWFSSDKRPSGGIQPGKRWEANIHGHLRESTVVLSIVTPTSLDRVWLYWEAAIASENCPGGVVPIMLGVAFDDLPLPLSSFQGVNGLSSDDLCSALSKIGKSALLEAPADYLGKLSKRFVGKVTPLINKSRAVGESILEDRTLVTREEFSEVVSRFERRLDALAGDIDAPQVLGEREDIPAPGLWLLTAARQAIALGRAGAHLELETIRPLVFALFNSGDFQQALELQRHVVSNASANAPDYYNLGRLLDDSDRTDEAEQAYRTAVALDVNFVLAWCCLGLIISKRGQYDEARCAYEKALSIDPHHALTWYNLGLLLAHMGRKVDAALAYQNALQSNPEDSFAWNNLGILLSDSGRTADAEEAYGKAVKHNPGNAAAWTNLANVLFETGRMEKAERAYRRAIEADPRYRLAWYNLATLLIQMDRLEEAREAGRTALEIDPDDNDSRDLVASLLDENG